MPTMGLNESRGYFGLDDDDDDDDGNNKDDDFPSKPPSTRTSSTNDGWPKKNARLHLLSHRVPGIKFRKTSRFMDQTQPLLGVVNDL